MAHLFIAVETFSTERRGRSEMVNAGDVAELGSWTIENYPSAFRPLEVRWKAPVDPAQPADASKPTAEAAASSPAESSPASPASIRKRGGRPPQS